MAFQCACVFSLTCPLSDNSFGEISGLEQCCMLTHLNLAHNKISRISGLDSLPLTHLCLVGSPLAVKTIFQSAHLLTSAHTHTPVRWLFEDMSHCARLQQSYLSPSLSLWIFPHISFHTQWRVSLVFEDHHMVQQRVSICACMCVCEGAGLHLCYLVVTALSVSAPSVALLWDQWPVFEWARPPDTHTLSIQRLSNPIPDPSSTHAASLNSTDLSGSLFHSPSQHWPRASWDQHRHPPPLTAALCQVHAWQELDEVWPDSLITTLVSGMELAAAWGPWQGWRAQVRLFGWLLCCVSTSTSVGLSVLTCQGLAGRSRPVSQLSTAEKECMHPTERPRHL